MKKQVEFDSARARMVDEQLLGRGIKNERVIAAMRKVPRHLFVPVAQRELSYDDCPLTLGPDETISQPYIIALMLEEAQIGAKDRVLEVGTGSGYEAALLAELAGDVFSVEIDGELLKSAQAVLVEAGYSRVHCQEGDGNNGLPEKAPFDVILVSAAPPKIPRELIRQLKPEGRLILPLGEADQDLVLVRKAAEGLKETVLGEVRFVKMKCAAEEHD